VIFSLERQDGSCRVALSPDNRLAAFSDDAGRVRLIEVASGKEVQRLRGHRGQVSSLEFSGDGRLLLSASEDTTALVWDVRECLSEAARAELPCEAPWDDLASEDAATAFRAALAIRANPGEGMALLRRHVRAALWPDPQAVRKLIGQLDSDQFEVRERAANRLRDLDQTAIPLLKEALKTSASLETRHRLERLLAEAEERQNSPQRLRDLRAIHCLTAIGTGPARQLLQTLAEGAPEALLTQQAREELEWFQHQGTGP
jgi:hypothetical protein